ncbi:MAG TPA: hypothetical protein VFE62_19225 [Gemmataceae bacterium]|nr:hypothetical protein [Gemmataceae bacterium]
MEAGVFPMLPAWNRFICSLEELLEEILEALKDLRPKMITIGISQDTDGNGPSWSDSFTSLECLLIPTNEYRYLMRHITNSEQYFAVGEFGAAAFEVNLALRRGCLLRTLHT